ncbi:hypothetical protein RB620_12290 [Paenibacillus sp. LHD-117]|uniref:hypothetical protein n=1 Tax=Paenibacillus sp. LHD-117 TaxID=3071412 RepID=UPI0027E08CB4|nr:hypothetical protein [Paenibacillus sp. LHD-117]MDQ6420216.1 hypothetical protein [Paenibacillus sp. LHD-117]
MKREPDIHETQPERLSAPEEPYRDPNMETIQRVEGGGPIRKVNMEQMPKPLRYFGYAVAGFMLVCTVIFLVSGWLN